MRAAMLKTIGVAIGFGVVLFGGVQAYAQTYPANSPYYTNNAAAYDMEPAPVYNQGAAPIPLNQLVAGQNAPSYNYNNTAVQPYNFGSTTSPSGQYYVPQGTLTPQQEAALQAQILQQQQYAQQYGAPQNDANNLAAQLAQLNQGPFGTNADEQPTKRTVKRVVRNALNDPLKPPPRLFNPDQ